MKSFFILLYFEISKFKAFCKMTGVQLDSKAWLPTVLLLRNLTCSVGKVTPATYITEEKKKLSRKAFSTYLSFNLMFCILDILCCLFLVEISLNENFSW